MRLLAVLHLLSLVLVLFAACMLVPLGFSLALADGAHWAHVKALAATAAAGVALWAASHRAGRELQVRDGFLLVALVWTVLPGFATLPLLMQLPGLSFTDAYFEAASGLTASRSSIFEVAGKMCVVTPREARRRATLRLMPRSRAATV